MNNESDQTEKGVIENDGGLPDNDTPLSFYEEKQRMGNRRQPQKRLQVAKQDTNENVSSEPPSVIAIPVDQTLMTDEETDLDTLWEPVPHAPTMTPDERFQQITDMIVHLQRQQLLSFAPHQNQDSSATDSNLSNREQTVGLKTQTMRATARDPPASLSTASTQKQNLQRTQKPDPPAMQFLIDDMLPKLDPNGEVQSNDLNDWVQERLIPAMSVHREAGTSARADSSGLDDRKPPARRSDSLFAIKTDSEFPDFDERWQRAEQRVQSLCGKRDSAVDLPITISDSSRNLPDASNAPSQAASINEVTENTSQFHGAIRMAPVNRTPVDPKHENDSNVDTDGEPKCETKVLVSAPDPVTAHVVLDDDHSSQLQRLKEAVASLQEKQNVIDATVKRAEPIGEENEDYDDELSFLEAYGPTLILSFLALGVGIAVGLRMGHSRGSK